MRISDWSSDVCSSDLLGIAAVHAEEISREKSSLVATCPGADFQHGGPSVRRIARQQLQCQRAFGLWPLLFQRPNYVLGHFTHVRPGLTSCHLVHSLERKVVVSGKSVSERVDFAG